MAAVSLKDKIPPQNLDAEKAALGAMLLDIDAVAAVTGLLQPSDFYSIQHQYIYKAILSISESNQTPDIISLTDELRKNNLLEASGGPGYIASLPEMVPSSANVRYYAELIKNTSVRRSLIKTAGEIVSLTHDESIDNNTILDTAQKQIFALSEAIQVSSVMSLQEIIPEAVDNIEMLFRNKGALSGIPSGLSLLDEKTSGFHSSELIIIGARPSIGKTALAISMAVNISIVQKRPSAFFSLEMPRLDLVKRIISIQSSVPLANLRTGRLTASQLKRMMDANSKLFEAPLYIVDTPYMRLNDLKTLARQCKMQNKVEIIFIDYIGLISNENALLPRHEQVAEISRSLKGLARELKIPIVVLSQVKREVEGGKPTLADLRESGSLEQDADVVMMMHRSRTDDEGKGVIPTELIIAKQRNGPLGTIPLNFVTSTTKYEQNSNDSADRN